MYKILQFKNPAGMNPAGMLQTLHDIMHYRFCCTVYSNGNNLIYMIDETEARDRFLDRAKQDPKAVTCLMCFNNKCQKQLTLKDGTVKTLNPTSPLCMGCFICACMNTRKLDEVGIDVTRYREVTTLANGDMVICTHSTGPKGKRRLAKAPEIVDKMQKLTNEPEKQPEEKIKTPANPSLPYV